MASDNTHSYIRTIGIVIAIVASVIGLTSGNVSKATFNEFKEGTVHAIITRLERIERKQDKVLEFLEQRHDHKQDN